MIDLNAHRRGAAGRRGPRRPVPRRQSPPSGSAGGSRIRRSWPLAVLALATAAVFAVAFGEIGSSTASSRTEQEIVTAQKGVVQSTVTGTGSLEPVVDEDVNFAASGTIEHVYVHTGERVLKGQLLATLDPTLAQLTLKEARATLAAARTALATAKTAASTSSSTSTATSVRDSVDDVSYALGAGTDTAGDASPVATPSASTTTTQSATTTTTTDDDRADADNNDQDDDDADHDDAGHNDADSHHADAEHHHADADVDLDDDHPDQDDHGRLELRHLRQHVDLDDRGRLGRDDDHLVGLLGRHR